MFAFSLAQAISALLDQARDRLQIQAAGL